jgi:hypothetical protein
MRKKTFLLVVILLIFAKSALGIEIEPNNNSAQANKLGKENVGQLKKNSDVDFFSIDNSCIKYTVDDQQTDKNHKAGTCVKYTADDEKVDPSNKAGEDKYRSEVSLSFACDSYAIASVRRDIGWYVSIYNPKGEEQANIQIKPDDCVTGAADSKGPYRFKFFSDKQFSTYYLAVVGDCQTAVTLDSTNLNAGTSCDRSNTATYTIKEEIPPKTPYSETEITRPLLSFSGEETGQVKTENAFMFYKISDNSAGISLEFSCHKNAAASAGVDTSGWVVSIWSTDKDGKLNSEVDANYDIAPQDCTPNESDTSTYTYTTTTSTGTVVNTSTSTSTTPVYSWTPTGPYKITIPKPESCDNDKCKTYFVGVQSNCLTKPENTSSVPVPKNRITGYTNLDCAVNTSTFTIKKADSGESIDDLINNIKDKIENHNLGESKTDYIPTPTKKKPLETKLYYVDSGNSKNEIPLIFSCDDKTTRFANNWKLNIYNGVKVLQSSQFINGSDCATGRQGDNGPLKFSLPSGSSRYYLTLKSACATDDKNCVVETSSFTISRDKLNLTAGVAVPNPYANMASSPKLTALELKKKGQITSVKDFRFFSINREITDDISLDFECPKSSNYNSNGWVVSVWNHDKSNKNGDEIQNVYSISSDKCSAIDSAKIAIPFQIPLSPTPIDKSYYIGVQTSCLTPIPLDADNSYTPLMTAEPGYSYVACVVNTDTFTLKLPESSQKLNSTSLSMSNNLGNDKSGQINSIDDNDIYTIESDGSADIPLIFSCSSMAVRQTNNWKLDVYNNANELVPALSSKFINGSNCAWGFVGDKGGYLFTLPKGSNRYYLSIKPVCDSLEKSKKECQIDTAEYSISRDVNKVYAIKKLVNPQITKTTADLKLAGCGLNKNAVINLKAENVNLANAFKNKTNLPINVQIGGVACRVLAPELVKQNPIIGDVTGKSEIIDSPFIANDHATITLSNCDENSSEKAKITLTASKLDLENLNFEKLSNTVSIPVKVSIGDFECEAKESFYISDFNGETYYSLTQKEDSSTASTSTTTGTNTDTSTLINTLDSFDSIWLTKKINLGATLQSGQISLPTDTQIYQIDTGTEDANLTFSCNNAVRYQNDWKMLIYDSTKALKSTTFINGSSCGMGKQGDSGAYAISLTKDSPTYYLVVKSACESDDKTCVVDKSQYQLKRVTATQAVANETVKPCFGTGCTTIKSTTVKPFFK